MHIVSIPTPALILALISTVCMTGSGPGHPLYGEDPAERLRKTVPPSDSLLLQGKKVLSRGVEMGSIDSLKKARALFQRATGHTEHRSLAHYYIALADYRLNNQFRDDAEEEREQVLQNATTHLQSATKHNDKFADAWALLAGVYGQRIGLNPMKGMTLGAESDAALKQAKNLQPDNPRVWIIDGTQDFFTPRMFGGDKEAALRKFKKAATLAEKEDTEDPLQPSWGHAEAYAWIGVAHMDADRLEQAQTAFERALEINPEFGWVKRKLLPRLTEEKG